MQLNVEVELQDLAEFIFKQNVNNARIYIDFSCLNNAKDLFFFLVHLLCKGLVIIYGTHQMIEFDNISFEKYEHIFQKLACIGVKCKLGHELCNDNKPPSVTFCVTHSQNLEDMYILIVSHATQYTICFQLMH